MPTPVRPRDLYVVERPDALLENSIEAVRRYDPPATPEVLLLKPSELVELLSGKLIAYTTTHGDTLLLAVDE